MHVGHCRGAVFGDALANLLAFAGYDVTREYYINDARRAGRRARALGVPALPRGARRERSATIPEGLYPGDYLKPVGQALAAEHGDELAEHARSEGWLPIARAARARGDAGADPRTISRRSASTTTCSSPSAR